MGISCSGCFCNEILIPRARREFDEEVPGHQQLQGRCLLAGKMVLLVDSLVRVGTVLEQDDINSGAFLWISASPKLLKPMVFQIWSHLWTHCCDFLGEIIQKLRIRDECTGPTLLKPWLQSFLWRKGLVAKLGPYQDPVCSRFTIWNRVAFSHQIHPLPTSINS